MRGAGYRAGRLQSWQVAVKKVCVISGRGVYSCRTGGQQGEKACT